MAPLAAATEALPRRGEVGWNHEYVLVPTAGEAVRDEMISDFGFRILDWRQDGGSAPLGVFDGASPAYRSIPVAARTRIGLTATGGRFAAAFRTQYAREFQRSCPHG